MLVVSPNTTRFLFIIRTDSYSGNFERDMCAYLTGTVGDCGVGDDFAEMFQKEETYTGLSDIILQVADEHGCYRPCAICIDDDDIEFNNVAIFFEELPSDDELELMVRRAKAFPKAFAKLSPYKKLEPEIKDFKLVERIVRIDEKELWKEPS